MPKFAKIPIDNFVTIQSVYKLSRDGKCWFDKFCIQMDKDANKRQSFKSIIHSYLESVANNEILPKKIFRKLKTSVNAWELKKDAIRLYLFFDEGVVIVIGGTKGTQERDIEKLEKIIKEYFDSKIS